MSLGKELGRAMMKAGVSRFFKMRHGESVVRFYPSKMSLVLWTDRWYGRDSYGREARFFGRYLRPGEVAVDVGANIGLYALAAARAVGPEGRVYAIEAHPRTYRYLKGNVELNGLAQVETLNLALGSRSGTVRFSNLARDDENAVEQESGGLEVGCKRLDELGIDGPIALMKVDVEGYEKFVLEGAGEVLERVGCLIFESDEGHFRRFGYTGADLLALVRKAGLAVCRWRDGRLEQVEAGNGCGGCENLLGVRDAADFMGRMGQGRPGSCCQR